MSSIKKVNITEQDLWLLYEIEFVRRSTAFYKYFELQNINQKKVQIIKKYTNSFVDLGNVISEIKKEYNEDKLIALRKKYGEIDVSTLKTSKMTRGQFYAILFLFGIGFSLGLIFVLGVIYWKQILIGIGVIVFILGALGSIFMSEKKTEYLYDDKGNKIYKRHKQNNGEDLIEKL